MELKPEVKKCEICEKAPGFKAVHSKKFGEDVWICAACLSTGKEKGVFSHKETKIGRNELCPCASGLKFKKCCMSQFRKLQDVSKSKR